MLTEYTGKEVCEGLDPWDDEWPAGFSPEEMHLERPPEPLAYTDATLSARAAAQALDLAAYGALFFGLWYVPQLTGWNTDSFLSHFSSLVLGHASRTFEFSTSLLFLTVGWVTFYFYFVLIPLRFGATVGKQMFHLQVVSIRGGSPSAGELFVRETIGKGCLGIMATKGLLLLLPLFKKDGRGIPDLISGTIVRKTARKA